MLSPFGDPSPCDSVIIFPLHSANPASRSTSDTSKGLGEEPLNELIKVVLNICYLQFHICMCISIDISLNY